MAYTNIELVRKHLQESVRSEYRIENHRLVMQGSDPVPLPHAGLISGSEVVKGSGQLIPRCEEIVLGDESEALERNHLLPGSVVVAGDTSLTQIYRENGDFVVDYPGGAIRRVAQGDIEAGHTVLIWYCHYTIYSRNTDYLISYQNGELTRIDSGSIADGQIVWIDYQTESGVFADDVIGNAIIEASAQMDSRIDKEAVEDSVPMLTIAETYLAVSILTQIRAIEMIQSNALSASNRKGLATELREISERYRQQSDGIVRRYLKPGSRLTGPVISS